MAKQWRCAVVGCGVVGEWHIRVIPRVPNAKLVAVCDPLPEKAQAALAKNNLQDIPIYTSQEEMQAKEDIDVIHICTPSGDHLNPALMAIDAGKNVVCEKPMEIQLDRIDQMIKAAEKKKVRLAGIFQNRWNPANRALKDAAEQGRFGTIAFGGSYTPWYRTDEYYREGGWRGTWKLDGGGAIMNQSVHAVDLIQWIVGPVKAVSAYASSRIHPEIEVEDTLACSLTFENGAHGIIMGSTAMYPGSAVRVEVGGANGTAVSEGGLKTWKFRDKTDADDQLLDEINNKKPGTTSGGASATDMPLYMHSRNIQHILESWDQGKDAETAGPEARKAIAIIVAMYESARKNGAPIHVK